MQQRWDGGEMRAIRATVDSTTWQGIFLVSWIHNYAYEQEWICSLVDRIELIMLRI